MQSDLSLVRNLCLLCFLCRGARPVNDEAVAEGGVAVVFADAVHEGVEFFGGELDDLVGLHAHQVAGGLAAKRELVVGAGRIDQDLFDDLRFEQVLERAVDRGLGHAVLGVLHLGQQFVGLEDAFLAEHGVEDKRAFGGELEPLAFEEAPKDRAHRLDEAVIFADGGDGVGAGGALACVGHGGIVGENVQ